MELGKEIFHRGAILGDGELAGTPISQHTDNQIATHKNHSYIQSIQKNVYERKYVKFV